MVNIFTMRSHKKTLILEHFKALNSTFSSTMVKVFAMRSHKKTLHSGAFQSSKRNIFFNHVEDIHYEIP